MGLKEILPPGLEPGLRPHPGLNGYKPFVLPYTTGEGDEKLAERGGHAPHPHLRGTISLAPSPGSLIRFTFLWCSQQDLHLYWFVFEANVSAVGLCERVLPAGLAPAMIRV